MAQYGYAVIYSISGNYNDVSPGGSSRFLAIVRNKYSSQINVRIGTQVFSVGGQFLTDVYFDANDINIDPGLTAIFAGNFTMPSQNGIIRITTYFYTAQGYVLDDTKDVAFRPYGTEPPPTVDYNLTSYIVYPASGTYSGDAEMCSFTFNAPLTIIPGVTWLVNRIVGAYVSNVIYNNATPLELQVYSKPGSFGSTDYLIRAIAYSNIAAMNRRKGSVFLAPIAWAAIGVGLAAVLGVTIIFAIKEITTLRYGPRQTTTTTTESQTTDLNAGQSAAIIDGAATVRDNGGGETTVTDSSGKTTTLPPGGVATVGQGATIIAGNSGATMTTAASTTTTTGPSNPTGAGFDITSIAKYAAIGGGILIGGTLLINLVSVFRK